MMTRLKLQTGERVAGNPTRQRGKFDHAASVADASSYLVVAIMLACNTLSIGTTRGGEFDIDVKDRAVVQRCVTDQAARNIAVGMPGGFSFAFDPVRCRLAYVWFGNFLDLRPEATGRGGGTVNILGTKRFVGTTGLPLRIGSSRKEPRSIRFDGYRKESATGIPTFLFRVDDVPIEQRVLSFGHDQVTIELSFPEDGNSTRYYHTDPKAVASIQLSERLQMNDSGVIEIPASESWAQIRLTLKPTKERFVRKEPTTNGRLLYALHCMSCHTLDGKKKIGPSFADLWTRKRTVTRDHRSEEVTADEQYIRESILQPQAAIVQGYEKANKMVDIRKTLNEKQIEALVKFLMDQKPKN
jgi:mono/diheme cytochrome c family protein